MTRPVQVLYDTYAPEAGARSDWLHVWLTRVRVGWRTYPVPEHAERARCRRIPRAHDAIFNLLVDYL